MSIHYKFKSANQYDTVTFDGLNISVKDLKKQIMQKKKFGKSTDFDLQITNAQTKETYMNENDLIPKNTSLIVARVPIAAPQKKQWDRDNHAPGGKNNEHGDVGILNKSVNIAALDISEEEKIKTMMSQSTSEYDPSNYVKVKGGNQVGPVPTHYVCYKCHQRGHWIKDCKATADGGVGVSDIIKKSSGIPRSFMVPVEGPLVPGARLTPTGQFAVPAIDHQVYKEKKVEKPPFLAEKEKPAETTSIPDDLVCSICKDLMQDAVMAPCCGNSFCDECIRNLLVESEEAECPECNEKEVSPDTLIPNRFLRNAVNNFKNKTGYIKKVDNISKVQSPPAPPAPRPILPDFVPPGTEVPGEKKTTADVASPANEPAGKTPDSEVNDKKRDPSPRKSREKKRDDNDDLSSMSSKNSDDDEKVLSKPKPGKSNIAYNIPVTIPTLGMHPAGIPYMNNYPHMNPPPFMRHDRSGTPTVDERYDPYGRPPMPGPLMGPIPGPMYNPQYPPPMMQFGNDDFRDRGRQFRGRYPPHYANRDPYVSIANDQEEAYLKFQEMLEKKNEWERLREKKKQARSRSRSRPRSISRPRSRSHSNSKQSPSGRRRSYTPKRSRSRSRRSRSGSRSPRSHRDHSFVMSRSRSRSFTPKSPIDRKISPRRGQGSSRSPSRYDRRGEFYGQDGNFEWDRRDRRGAVRTKNRAPPLSPRHYSTYQRYRDDYEAVQGRNLDDRYNERTHSDLWPDQGHGNRRRSRSKSPTKPFTDDSARHGDGRGHRSRSRSRRERSHDDRHRRDKKSRDNTGRRQSKEKSRDRDKDRKKRDSSPEKKAVSRDRSRSRSEKRSRSKEQINRTPSPAAKGSETPTVDERREVSPVKETSPVAKKQPSPVKERSESAVKDVPVNSSLWKPIIGSRFENEPLERNPSPLVVDKSPKLIGKKDKKKDKERKKKKKEKETDEEKEARRKRKKEKKDEKKKKEIGVITQSSDLEYQLKVANDESPKRKEVSLESKRIANVDAVPKDATIEPEPHSEPNSHPENEFDDVLDLHPSTEDLVDPEMLAPMPALSKWEVEEPVSLSQSARHVSPELSRENAVTNEVLKRAENAIFKKAISAIRPEQLKKHSDKPDERKSRTVNDPEKEKRATTPEKKRESSKKSSKEEVFGKIEDSSKRVTLREDASKRSKEDSSRRVEVKEKPAADATRDVDRIFQKVPLKGKTDGRKPGNSIQITIPVVTDKDPRDFGFSTEKAPLKISTQPRLSILERLGRKVDESSELTSERSEKKQSKNSFESSDENGDFVKHSSNRSQSSDSRKRRRSSSGSSDASTKVAKKKHQKHKKEKKSKKKHRKATSDSSESSDDEADRKRRKKNKKNKKSRH